MVALRIAAATVTPPTLQEEINARLDSARFQEGIAECGIPQVCDARADLALAVPAVAHWRLASLPHHLT
jgi:hypothetical protein